MQFSCRIMSVVPKCGFWIRCLLVLQLFQSVIWCRTTDSHLLEQEAKYRLSRVFGLDYLPVQKHHRAPPQYMVELYKSVADENGIVKTMTPFNANTVRGFPDRDSQHQMHFYYYNVSYIKKDEALLEAEFHLFKLRPRPQDIVKAMMNEGRSLHLIEIRIYQVLDPNRVTSSDGLRLLDVSRISLHAHGWHVFQVKQAIEDWLKDSNKNHGFLVTATSLSGRPLNGTLVRFAQRGQHHESKQPVLVAFTDDGRREYSQLSYYMGDIGIDKEYRTHHPDRHKKVYDHSYQQQIRLLNARDRDDFINENSEPRSRVKRSSIYRIRKHRKPVCARHEMYVDFEEIGWSGWIISPKGYNAYHCKGECPFPLGQNQKPTNHATVQSIVHALHKRRDISTPCCVPNKLFSISLLYFDDDENVILKQYDGMVAAACGCH